MCSELTPRARIPDTRIPQLMQPWTKHRAPTLFCSAPPKGGDISKSSSSYFQVFVLDSRKAADDCYLKEFEFSCSSSIALFRVSRFLESTIKLQESDKGQIFYWSIQTCTKIRLLIDRLWPCSKTSKLPYFRLFRPDTQILSALTALY